MGNENDNTFTWVIKDFSTLKSEEIYSDIFVVGGCEWRLKAFPKGNKIADYFSIYLQVSESKSLPSGWRRHAKFTFTLQNHVAKSVSRSKAVHWFNEKESDWGFTSMIPLSDLHAKGMGFLLNGEIKIVANIEVLEVTGELDDVLRDVNGQLLPSQVKTLKRVLEIYPENASKLRKKNPLMKSAYMNLVLSVMETLRRSPDQISKDDMFDANVALEFVACDGIKLDWLDDRLHELSEKKEKLEACEKRVEKLEGELNDLKEKCSDVEALLEKEKAELLILKAPLSVDIEALLEKEKAECS